MIMQNLFCVKGANYLGVIVRGNSSKTFKQITMLLSVQVLHPEKHLKNIEKN